ncbi:hypothetical protein EVAR_53855_1 [Eumeta japonica]|uniref:Uncharacterized protein n=1 Tax=Eumeta variegata TaxID=151549 RepID=A0A4C1XIK0_EUMVA|nr:hypothetical protein EVAR_53855_1 [Eumeta japonica]
MTDRAHRGAATARYRQGYLLAEYIAAIARRGSDFIRNRKITGRFGAMRAIVSPFTLKWKTIGAYLREGPAPARAGKFSCYQREKALGAFFPFRVFIFRRKRDFSLKNRRIKNRQRFKMLKLH